MYAIIVTVGIVSLVSLVGILIMSDKFIRHLISIIGTFLALLIYFVGYATGSRGWWLAGFTIIGVYIIIYKLVDV